MINFSVVSAFRSLSLLSQNVLLFLHQMKSGVCLFDNKRFESKTCHFQLRSFSSSPGFDRPCSLCHFPPMSLWHDKNRYFGKALETRRNKKSKPYNFSIAKKTFRFLNGNIQKNDSVIRPFPLPFLHYE